MLPGVYQGDDFAQRFTSGLDEVAASVFCTLDNLPAYFDAHLAPSDFLDFLALWVGIEFEAGWSIHRRRQVIAQAIGLHRRRGTARGIRAAVALVADAAVEVRENGGSHWSASPGSELPGSPAPGLVVRIDVEDMSDLWRRRIDALVEAVKPAHVPHRIEFGPVDAGPGDGEADTPPVVGQRPSRDEVADNTAGWAQETEAEASIVEHDTGEASADGARQDENDHVDTAPPGPGEANHIDSVESTDSLADDEDRLDDD
jgi:phage tail-like protein